MPTVSSTDLNKRSTVKLSDSLSGQMYQTMCSRLDTYNNQQFKYRSLCATVLAAYFAALQFIYLNSVPIVLSITIAMMVSMVVLVALIVFASLDLTFQDLIEQTIRGCLNFENEILGEAQAQKIGIFTTKNSKIGPVKMNLVVSAFYLIPVLIVAVLFLKLGSFALSIAPAFKTDASNDQLIRLVDLVCSQSYVQNQAAERVFKTFEDCRSQIEVLQISNGTAILFFAMQLGALCLIFWFALFLIIRIISLR